MPVCSHGGTDKGHGCLALSLGLGFGLRSGSGLGLGLRLGAGFAPKIEAAWHGLRYSTGILLPVGYDMLN